MKEVEKKIFDSINRGYLNLVSFNDTKITNNITCLRKQDENSFLEDFRFFMNSFNYMGMDEVVAKHLVHCIFAHQPKYCLVFIQYITLLAIKLKEDNITTDARSQASIDFLISDIAVLKLDILNDLSETKKEIIKDLMLKAMSSTHRTIFQSFIRTLSLSSKKLINEDKIGRIVVSQEYEPIEVFFKAFSKEDVYFPFI